MELRILDGKKFNIYQMDNLSKTELITDNDTFKITTPNRLYLQNTSKFVLEPNQIITTEGNTLNIGSTNDVINLRVPDQTYLLSSINDHEDVELNYTNIKQNDLFVYDNQLNKWTNKQLEDIIDIRYPYKVQSILYSKTNSEGRPDFMYQDQNLFIHIDGTITPLIVSFQNGFSNNGLEEIIKKIDFDLQTPNLPINSTCFIYLEYNQNDDIISQNYSLQRPIYSKIEPQSFTTDIQWFDINEMKMKVFNGNDWEYKYRLYLGEVMVDNNQNQVIFHKPLRYYYDSGWYGVIQKNSIYVFSHNFGFVPDIIKVYLQNDFDGVGDFIEQSFTPLSKKIRDEYGSYVFSIDETDIHIKTQKNGVCYYRDENDNIITSLNYIRVIQLRGW